MPSETTLLYLYAETPLHAGVGRQSEAAIDLPIQRDQMGYPIVRASSLKGALRGRAAAMRPAEEVSAVFGAPPETPEADKFPAALILGQASALLFPVRTLVGTFAWVTGAAMLARFQRDAAGHGVPLPALPAAAPVKGEALVTSDSKVRGPRGDLTLEELTFRSRPDPALATLGRFLAAQALPDAMAFAYWREKVSRDLVLLPEDAFRFFVTHSTEVAARTRIDPRTGAAAEGALWTEESLPADTLLYAPVAIEAPARPAATLQGAANVRPWLEALVATPFQVGGSRTLGHGFLRARFADGKTKGAP